MKSLEWLQKVAESLGGFRYVRTPIFNLDKALACGLELGSDV